MLLRELLLRLRFCHVGGGRGGSRLICACIARRQFLSLQIIGANTIHREAATREAFVRVYAHVFNRKGECKSK